MSAQKSPCGLPMCPIGGLCRADECGRTSQTCIAIFGPPAEHDEALRINAEAYPPGHPRRESMASFMARLGIEAAKRLTVAFRPISQPTCDCPLDPHHRWNCPLTPIWAQTIRDLDCNPWAVVRPRDIAMVQLTDRSK